MRRRRKKHRSLHLVALSASALNNRWCIDFIDDQLANGLAFSIPTMVDNWSQGSVLLEAGFRLMSKIGSWL